MNHCAESRLVLFSGIAADANVFMAQRLAFPGLVVPKWPEPNRKETLKNYCYRLIEQYKISSTDIVGGASFGGFIALEIATMVRPKAVLLIGSLRGPEDLPVHFRLWRPFRHFSGHLPVPMLQWSSAPSASKSISRSFPHLGGVAKQFSNANPKVLRWSIEQILNWKQAPQIDCPVFSIHGEFDRVLPIGKRQPDVVIANAGHLITLTHPKEVNSFIRGCVQTTS